MHTQALIKRGLLTWADTPIPHLKLSSSGLLALAQLSTVAQRTAITGGSSWLDCLLLAPGMHYQQAVDAVGDHLQSDYSAVEMPSSGGGGRGIGSSQEIGGQELAQALLRHKITNPATIRFLKRASKHGGGAVVIDVGIRPPREYWPRRRQRASQRATILNDQNIDLGLLSHMLYLASPVLTIAAFVVFALMEDCKFYLSFLAFLFFSPSFLPKRRLVLPRGTMPILP